MLKFGVLKIITIVAVIALSGCATSPISQVNYAPEGHEQFVFGELPEQIQKYGYDNFCKNKKTFACLNRLDYKDHVGKKGYFKTKEPVHKDYSGYEFWPVILETGKEYFYVSNEKYGGKYGSSAKIISLERYQRVIQYTPDPLVEGSEILVKGVKVSFGREIYSLSNGDEIDKEKLSNIRELADLFPKEKRRVAKALLNFKISKDNVDNKYFIQPIEDIGDILRNSLKLYIGVNDDRQWLRLKLTYFGNNWLFVSSYKIAADDYRWESPMLNFERDHSSKNVWEWIDTSPNEQDLKNLKALAIANKPLIRFQGKQYNSDFKLSSDQQKAIIQVLDLYGIMSRDRK